MPHTRGLQIKPETIIRKSRRLPTPGKVLVKPGEEVISDAIVARGYVPNPEIRVVRVYDELGVDPEWVKRYMLKEVGEEVEKEEVIAFRRSFFGLSTKVCKSPIEGTIELISDANGQAIIRGKPILIEVRAYIPGRVVEIIPEEGAVIESSAALIQGTFGVGGETHGELVIAVNSPNEVLSPDRIHNGHMGKILVGGSSVTLGTLREAVETGVKGIICGGVDQKELTNFLGYEIGVGITGDEEVGLTLILTEGFGQIPMIDKTFQLLRSFEGKQACIDGSTQIRYKVIRPEIILPLEKPEV